MYPCVYTVVVDKAELTEGNQLYACYYFLYQQVNMFSRRYSNVILFALVFWQKLFVAIGLRKNFDDASEIFRKFHSTVITAEKVVENGLQKTRTVIAFDQEIQPNSKGKIYVFTTGNIVINSCEQRAERLKPEKDRYESYIALIVAVIILFSIGVAVTHYARQGNDLKKRVNEINTEPERLREEPSEKDLFHNIQETI